MRTLNRISMYCWLGFNTLNLADLLFLPNRIKDVHSVNIPCIIFQKSFSRVFNLKCFVRLVKVDPSTPIIVRNNYKDELVSVCVKNENGDNWRE